MKIQFYLFGVLLLAYFSATSQVKFKIISRADRASLPYATISNLSQHTLFSANKFGEITLRAKKGDSLRITHVGYLPGNYVYSGNIEQIVALELDASLLPTVIVSNCEKYKEMLLKSNSGKKDFKSGDLSYFRGYGWLYGKENYQPIGMLLKCDHNEARLKKFSFWLKKMAAPDSAILAPWLISIFAVNDSTNLPSKPLINRPIVFYPQKGGKQTIHFDSIQVIIPSNGIYIMFQYIMDEKYAWAGNSVPNSEYTDSALYYGVCLEGVIDSGQTIAYYLPDREQWFKRPDNESLRFEAILTYCKE